MNRRPPEPVQLLTRSPPPAKCYPWFTKCDEEPRNVRFSKQVKCPVWSSNRNHSAVAVEAVGKCESRGVCGICKVRGEVCFLTFPLNVFSTSLLCFWERGGKSVPCLEQLPSRRPSTLSAS